MGTVLYFFFDGFSAGAGPTAGPFLVVGQDAFRPGPLVHDQWQQARAQDAFRPGVVAHDSPLRQLQGGNR